MRTNDPIALVLLALLSLLSVFSSAGVLADAPPPVCDVDDKTVEARTDLAPGTIEDIYVATGEAAASGPAPEVAAVEWKVADKAPSRGAAKPTKSKAGDKAKAEAKADAEARKKKAAEAGAKPRG